jgi:hypothetical protein
VTFLQPESRSKLLLTLFVSQSEEVLFKRRREDLTQFKNRPDLKQVKDSLVKLPLMIMSLAGTIKRLGAEANQYTVIPSASPQPQSFEYLLEEAELLQKRVDMLRDRVQDLTSFTHDKLNHLNSRYMMQVAESTKNDSAAMKYITIITVLFLPATFVAVRRLTAFQVIIRAERILDLLLHAIGKRRQWRTPYFEANLGIFCYNHSVNYCHHIRLVVWDVEGAKATGKF